MAASIVQSASTIGTTGSVTVTLGAAPTVGNTLVALMAADAYQTAAPTAGASRSYTSRLSTENNLGHYIWTRLVVSGDSATTTFTLGAASSACVVVEVAGTYDKVGTATTTNNSSAGTQACTGLTPATADGLVLAFAGVTSTNAVVSGVSVDNGFTTAINAINSVSGAGRANAFVSSKVTTSTAATGTTTISWSGFASDRTGAQVAFTGLTGGGSNAGTLTTAVPRAMAAVSGTQTDPGVMSATPPVLAAALTGVSNNAGTLAASAPLAVAAITGAQTNTGTLTASTPTAAAAVAGTMTNAAALTASLRVVTASLPATGTSSAATLAALVPLTVAQITGTSLNPGTLTASPRAPTSSITGASTNLGTLAGAAPVVTVAIGGTTPTDPATPTPLERRHVIGRENRTTVVPAEPRTTIIPAEPRTVRIT